MSSDTALTCVKIAGKLRRAAARYSRAMTKYLRTCIFKSFRKNTRYLKRSSRLNRNYLGKKEALKMTDKKRNYFNHMIFFELKKRYKLRMSSKLKQIEKKLLYNF